MGTFGFWKGLLSGGTADETGEERTFVSQAERTGAEAADHIGELNQTLREATGIGLSDIAVAMIPGPKGPKSVSQMATGLKARLGKNSIGYETSGVKGNIDLEGRAHFDKATQSLIPTPHVQEKAKSVGPDGQINIGSATARPATKRDIRVAERLARNKGLIP